MTRQVHTTRVCCKRSSRMTVAPTSKAESSYAESIRAENISYAMRVYLMKAKEHETFMQSAIAEYDIGKRHLATIMGADPDTFTQEDIDKALEYLLPSGLENPDARPKMKHPADVFPRRKVAEMDLDGRPFNYMFYTVWSSFYNSMHEARDHYEKLNKELDVMRRKNLPIEGSLHMPLGSSAWLTKEELQLKFTENMKDDDYARWLTQMSRLADHPLSMKVKDFLMEHRKVMADQAVSSKLAEVQVDEDGRVYAESEARRKTARAVVKVYDQGSGVVLINNRNFFDHFPRLIDRLTVMFPIQFCGRLGEVDVHATVDLSGPTAQAGAVRLGVALSLQPFISQDLRDKMRIAGLLTSDPRSRERKLPGQEGARRKFTWKKR